jgi:hypothetical protein
MTEWTTIRIRESTKANAESDKHEHETWDNYVNPETDTDTEKDVDLEPLMRRIDDLETELKRKIEQQTRR